MLLVPSLFEPCGLAQVGVLRAQGRRWLCVMVWLQDCPAAARNCFVCVVYRSPGDGLGGEGGRHTASALPL